MNTFYAALWAESLKARRSKVPLLTTIGFMLAPLTGGLFMIIMKDPERARNMGLLSTKAQLVMSTAEWSTFFGMEISPASRMSLMHPAILWNRRM